MASLAHSENAPFLQFLLREVARLPIEIRRGRALSPESCARSRRTRWSWRPAGASCCRRSPATTDATCGAVPRLRALVKPAARWLTPTQLRAATRLWMPFGRRVVVVGADLAALELAELLALRGRRVTIVERGERLAPEVGLKRLTEHMDALDRLGVAVNTGVAYEEITPRGIAIRPRARIAPRDRSGHRDRRGRARGRHGVLRRGEGRRARGHTVGDCTGLGLIRKATEEATRVAAACNLTSWRTPMSKDIHPAMLGLRITPGAACRRARANNGSS
jgi:2,4-dienoyl-CoA reductase (NADPH2)